MDDALHKQLQQELSDFTRHHEALVKARDEMAALTVTARSKDKAVEVTVGAQGEPTGLRFLNNKHQTMTAQKLAASVLEVLTTARQQVAQEATARFAEVSDFGLGIAGSGLKDLDLDRLLEPLTATDNSPARPKPPASPEPS
ncbi:YbaB/EbfC family nucleoid-associated protein [Streptomyces sp. NPDC057694]|uniref:YbaB/EbfC family nucleoid-associated protein n=1 Tax=Streptomyces sp. NPDC057694 TaxID=3346216 RepID=UPI0036B1EE24